MLRVLKRAGIAIGSLLLVSILVVYGTSEWMMRRTHDVPAKPLRVDVAQADIAHGERLAKVLGCAGCHDDLAGGIFMKFPDGTRVASPNLIDYAGRHDPAKFARAVRQGVRADGTSVVGMPSELFSHLADSDIASIYAYLRSIPHNPNQPPRSRYGPVARFMVFSGGFQLPADSISNSSPPIARPATNDPLLGSYLAAATCAECHGSNYKGQDGSTPELPPMVAAYSPADFEKLMRTGTAVGGRQVGLMTRMGQLRYSHLTDEEIAALYSYLSSLNQ